MSTTEYDPFQQWLQRKPKSYLRAILAQPQDYPIICCNISATQIQRVFRGYITRKYLRKGGRFKFQKYLRDPNKDWSPKTDEDLVLGVTHVQSTVRMLITRRIYERLRWYNDLFVYNLAASQIQGAWLSRVERQKQREEERQEMRRRRAPPVTAEDIAATKIQNAWRACINKQIYRFYRDLIKFRERGHPRYMLKCINPREAGLMDSAAGIHVRFRLGGSQFPPTIYYKIFTHNPLIDINAFAPRDYAAARKRPLRSDGGGGGGLFVEFAGWYERRDRNNWRPISDTVLKDAEDEERQEGQKQQQLKQPFHYNPVKRREDVERAKKQKKVLWMQKMYQEAKRKTEGGGEDTNTFELTKTQRDAGDDLDDLDFEGDEDLIKWSQALDFDKYHSDWLGVATTLGSDYTLKMQDMMVEGDPDQTTFDIANLMSKYELSESLPLRTPRDPPDSMRMAEN